jgi:hypothetical protein
LSSEIKTNDSRPADKNSQSDWQFVAELTKKIDDKDFNGRVGFSLRAAKISDDDKLPKDWKNPQCRKETCRSQTL